MEENKALRVLLVDDDTELCELVSQYLKGRGFIVDIESDGEAGFARAQNSTYQLLILDVMLPGINGFEILRQLRAGLNPTLPIIMLTAHGDEIDRIVGLELGADDYLPKPFNPRELLARIRAVLRRSSETAAPTSTSPESSSYAPAGVPAQVRLSSDDLVMNVAARSVQRGGVDVELTATEFDLLHALLTHAGSVVSRDSLSREVLGRRLLPLDRSLDLHMSKLRRKLGPKANGGERIKTLRGVGYLIEATEGSV